MLTTTLCFERGGGVLKAIQASKHHSKLYKHCAINQSQPFFRSLCTTFVIVRNPKHFLL
jgi:hypothetical protein